MFLLDLSFNNDNYITIINIILNVAFFFILYNAMSGFAKYYEDSKIYKNSRYAVIMGIIGLITAPIVLYIMNLLSPNILLLILNYIYIAIIFIPMGVFFKNAFYALAEKSGEQHFRHAGWLIFIGGILTVIVIGIFVIFLGRMFAVLAFYSMKPKSSQTATQ
jgi:uncharacterized membrane protein